MNIPREGKAGSKMVMTVFSFYSPLQGECPDSFALDFLKPYRRIEAFVLSFIPPSPVGTHGYQELQPREFHLIDARKDDTPGGAFELLLLTSRHALPSASMLSSHGLSASFICLDQQPFCCL